MHSPDARAGAMLLGDAVVELAGERLLVRADDAAGLNRHLVSSGVRVERLGPYVRDLEQVVLEASHAVPAVPDRRVEVLT